MNETRHPQVDQYAPINETGLHVRASRTGDGKSSDARALAVDLAATRHVVYVSTEEDLNDITRHMVALADGPHDPRLARIWFLEATSIERILITVADIEKKRGEKVHVVIDYVNNLKVKADQPWKVDQEGIAQALGDLASERIVAAYASINRSNGGLEPMIQSQPLMDAAETVIVFRRDREAAEREGTWTIHKSPRIQDALSIPMRLVQPERSQRLTWVSA